MASDLPKVDHIAKTWDCGCGKKAILSTGGLEVCQFCDAEREFGEVVAKALTKGASDSGQRTPDPSVLVEALRELHRKGRYLKPYLEWTCGPESPGHHPTMPSAVSGFLHSLAEAETALAAWEKRDG